MINGSLSKEVLQFIVAYVDSVELLDVLVLLHSETEREWMIEELDAIVRSQPDSIAIRLAHLAELGLAAETGPQRFKYSPRSDALRQLGTELVFAYQNRRVEITELIYSKPMKEIMSFSDAFRLKRGAKKDG